ncbi:ABC transporter permease [Paenibacillus koleovorans]|uniref:ABC transporter permease n=1 Tax=Paenibacillus koleovorans TaxID=121608 RepID=UPI000FDACC43|nr:ABC transporter permease [Paenibacillus koleovorans]
MPMLRFLYRKMWNTRWLTISTLFGLIVAVAFTTSIPMYADGSLKRVVAKSLLEKSDGMPPGSTLIRYQAVGSERADLTAFADVDTYIREEVPLNVGFPHSVYARALSIRNAQLTPVDPTKVDPSKRRQMSIASLSGLAEKIELNGGRMFAEQSAAGTIEAVVLEDALSKNDVRVGDEFMYPISGGQGIAPLKVRIVGSFLPKAEDDPYWFQGFEGLAGMFLVSETVMQKELLEQRKIPLNLANWYYAFDLTEIKTSQLAPLGRTLERMDITLYQKLKDTRVDISFSDMLADFKRQSLQMQMLLFTLAAPMLAMVFYYIVMNARQALERQRSDIAVLRSRGGSTRQIIGVFLLEGVLLGAAALVLGPLLGWFMAKSIGSSNGFLTFVDRKSVPVDVSPESLFYGVGAVVLAIAASVIPAVRSARSSIVGYKQSLARTDRPPVWQRWYLDIVLIALSGYGYYSFQNYQLLSAKTGMTNDQLQVHPLLFFVPALSIFAIGLFCLRLFPWLLRLFNWLGRRFMPVSIFLTLTQLSRSAKSYYPLMVLLILTLGLGVYNSSAARTIDLNSTERTLYQYGTDVVIQTVWEGFAEEDGTSGQGTPGGQGQGQGGQGQGQGGQGGQGSGQGGSGQGGPGTGNPGGPSGQNPGNSTIRYIEPPFEVFRTLEGVDHAARVLQTKGSVIVSGRTQGQGLVMGIDNVDFADVGWFRRDLFPAEPREYLNLLGSYEQAVIVPSGFAEKNQLKPGDLINIAIQQQSVEFVIVGTLPYWPSQYPDETPFFIANLDYIYDQAPIVPYDVWLKMKPGAKLTPVIESLQAQNIQLADYKDVRNELITQAKHPARGGVFGILSLGFLVSVFISLIGYVLYWFFNLSSRVVQFGMLRAMGLSRRQLTGMLLLEQGFTAGLSIALGVLIGKLTSVLFLPFLQTAESAKTQVPPFRVVFEAKDANQLYLVVAFMMLTGAALLFLHIRRLRVHQAVKLGEER